MNEQDKQLLLKDLCVRLPYGVRVKLNGRREKSNKLTIDWLYAYSRHIEDIKPYLRPMSSMTEEEAKEIAILYGLKDILSIKITDEYIDVAVDDGVCSTERWTIWYDEIISSIEIFDWLNRKHFDFRGLIEKGLALEAPEGMYN